MHEVQITLEKNNHQTVFRKPVHQKAIYVTEVIVYPKKSKYKLFNW